MGIIDWNNCHSEDQLKEAESHMTMNEVHDLNYMADHELDEDEEMSFDESIRRLKEIRAAMKIETATIKIKPLKEHQEKNLKALTIAIGSLETDKAYNLMYEGLKVYTEDEVIEILAGINEKLKKLHSVGEDSHERFGFIRGKSAAYAIVEAEIDKLKGNK